VHDAGERDLREQPDDPRLLSPAFALITGSALAYFTAVGVQIPVLPKYIADELGGNGLEVGLGVGAFAVSAALLRPAVGRMGDRRGRRVLIVGGAAVAAVSVLGYLVATTLPVLIAMRLLTGVGEAAVFVGAATAVQDLAPPTRRGEATSYFSVAIYGGLAVGPLLGDLLRQGPGYGAVWIVSASLCVVALLLATRMPISRPLETDLPLGKPKLLHPAAVRPGVILALSATGYAGFSAFVPLYVDHIGVNGTGVVFAEYAFAILFVRIVFARLPDKLGSIRGASLALTFQAVGFVVLTAIASPGGLYTGTFIYSIGASMLYPSLFPLVVDNAPENERSQSIATFTLFFDVAQGLGAFVLGIFVTIGNERWAFGVAAALAALGLVLLRAERRREQAAAS
jgi:MFS family permease